jgi:hypothetical protein
VFAVEMEKVEGMCCRNPKKKKKKLRKRGEDRYRESRK